MTVDYIKSLDIHELCELERVTKSLIAVRDNEIRCYTNGVQPKELFDNYKKMTWIYSKIMDELEERILSDDQKIKKTKKKS